MDSSITINTAKLTLVGEEGKFFAVLNMSDENIQPSTNSFSGADTGDVFTCGLCKLQLYALDKFLAHKQLCSVSTPLIRMQEPVISNIITIPEIYNQQETRQILFINEGSSNIMVQANPSEQQNINTVEHNPIVNQSNVHSKKILSNKDQETKLGEQNNKQKVGDLKDKDELALCTTEQFMATSEQIMATTEQTLATTEQTIATTEHNISTSEQTMNMYLSSPSPCHQFMGEGLESTEHAKLILHSEPMLQALGEDSMDTTAVKNQLLSMSKERGKDLIREPKLVTTNCDIDNDKTKKAVCTYCGKSFRRSHDLSAHIRCHTGEKPFQCVVCGRGFAQKSNVKKHMVTHKVLPSGIHRLDNQPTESGTTDTSYQCGICKESFEDYHPYKSHLKNHDDEKVYRCVVNGCGECFPNVEDYVDHITSHQNMEYKCYACPDKFTDLNDLNLHQFTHLTDRDTREHQVFECSKCKNKYSSQTALDHHIESTDHSYSCAVCNKPFLSLRLLRKHMSMYHSESTLSCDICGQTVKTETALKRHKLVHSSELAFACDDCGARFNRKDKLKRHSLSHNWRKKFKCPFQEHMNCDKEFHRLDKLKQHITTHGNIKCFSCTLCEAKYTRKEHLKTHMSKKHAQATKSSYDDIKNQTRV